MARLGYPNVDCTAYSLISQPASFLNLHVNVLAWSQCDSSLRRGFPSRSLLPRANIVLATSTTTPQSTVQFLPFQATMILIILALLIYRYPKIAVVLLGSELYYGDSLRVSVDRSSQSLGSSARLLRWHQRPNTLPSRLTFLPSIIFASLLGFILSKFP